MKKLLIVLSMGMFVQFGTVQAIPDYDENPIADVMVDSAGGFLLEDYLATQGAGEYAWSYDSRQRSYLMFDLSDIPEGAQITSAIFGLYAYKWEESGGDGPWVVVHYVGDDSWDESLTWSNQPISLDINPEGYIHTSWNTTGQGPWEWDLLDTTTGYSWDWAADLANDDNLLSLMIRAEVESTDNFAWFYSSEYFLENYRPYLMIEYTIIPEPSAIILGTLGIGFFGALRRRRML